MNRSEGTVDGQYTPFPAEAPRRSERTGEPAWIRAVAAVGMVSVLIALALTASSLNG